MGLDYDASELERLLYRSREECLEAHEGERLARLLSESEDARTRAARYLMNDALLRNELRIGEVAKMFGGVDPSAGWMALHPAGGNGSAVMPERRAEQPSYSHNHHGRRPALGRFQSRTVAAAMVLLATMAAINALLLSRLNRAEPQSLAPRSIATLVDSTRCLWDDGVLPTEGSTNALDLNTSLRLLEGIAEIELNVETVGDASVQIEGPAGWLITDTGHPSLSYGKMTANASTGENVLKIDTPLGRIQIYGHTSLGIICFGSELEVHAFAGRAVVDSLWAAGVASGAAITLESGEMVRIALEGNAPGLLTHGVADSTRFASRLSMVTDDLLLDDRYASAVKGDRPVGYWRFESVRDGVVPNEMGGEYHARIEGEIQTKGTATNRYLEFEDTVEPGCLEAAVMTEQPFSGVFDSEISIELWVKPSHYHQASLVGLVKGPLDAVRRARHGALIELTGPHPMHFTSPHPGRFRFLNRYPAAQTPVKHESSFSNSAFELRRWQHVVAVKDRRERRLYVNGKLESRSPDTNPLADDLTMLVGRLHTDRIERRLVGQLDEIAIYGYPLSEEQIRRHFELARNIRKIQDEI